MFYEGLVAEVEPYGLAWQGGLRKGSRLLEVQFAISQYEITLLKYTHRQTVSIEATQNS